MIWQDNLDLLCRRESSNVRGIHSGLKELVRREKLAGSIVPLEYMPPCKVIDYVVMVIAIEMLEKSI